MKAMPGIEEVNSRYCHEISDQLETVTQVFDIAPCNQVIISGIQSVAKVR